MSERNVEERFIRPRELVEKLQDETPPFVIDVRDEKAWEAGHLREAHHIPADVLLESLNQVPKNRPLVVYCDMRHPGSSRSEQAAQRLRENGMLVRVLDGGFPAWEQAGYLFDQGK